MSNSTLKIIEQAKKDFGDDVVTKLLEQDCEPSGRLLPDCCDGWVEWGASIPIDDGDDGEDILQVYYMLDADDMTEIADNDGDGSCIDWTSKIERFKI